MQIKRKKILISSLRKSIYLYVIIFFSSFIACNSDMIEKGLDSTEDPRRPEISVKQGSTEIESGSTAPDDIVGVKVNSEKKVSFIIQNTGTADLVLSGSPSVIVTGDYFSIETSDLPSSNIIPSGMNEVFTLTYSPENTDNASAIITIENNDFDESSYTFTINANPLPIPKFSSRLRKGIGTLTADFIDRSEGEITAWEWDFGDGTISNEQNPTHYYGGPGNYNVNLTVTGPGGITEKSWAEYIQVYLPIKNIIDTRGQDVNGNPNACTADIDEDGDMDVLSAIDDGTDGIKWWENPAIGSKTGWETHDIIEDHGFGDWGFFASDDLDNDNDYDLAVVSTNGGRMLWFVNPDDLFPDPWTPWTENLISTGGGYTGQPFHIRDIDGINGVDIVCSTDGIDEEIVWYENNGSGDFSTVNWTSVLFEGPTSVNMADFDNDGDMDIIAAGKGNFSAYDDGKISWIENVDTDGPGTGDGSTWSEHIIIDNYEGQANYVIPADIDNDNNIDILESSRETGIAWWRNEGSGVFGARAAIDSTLSMPSVIFTMDLNRDGNMDVLSNEYDGGLFWWENINTGGTISWEKHLIDGVAAYSSSMFEEDIDLDGNNDLLSARYTTSNSISWYNFYKEWYISQIPSNELHQPVNVVSADLNGDNYLEIITAGDNKIVMWMNKGDGTLQSDEIIDDNFTDARSVQAIDIDNDNDLDLVGASNADGEIGIWENTDGHGTFGTKIHLGDLSEANSIAIADFDGDGDQDVLAGGSYALAGNDRYGQVVWFRNNGSMNFTKISIDDDISGSSMSIINVYVNACDFDADGDMDVVAASKNMIKWWENTDGAGTFSTQNNIDTSFTSVKSIHPADLDGDSYPDLIATNDYYSNYSVTWWKNNQNNTFTKIKIDDLPGAVSAYASDVDNDGDLDVLSVSDEEHNMIIWENNLGTATPWKMRIIGHDFFFPNTVYAADIDGDSDPDILGTSENGLFMWENNILNYGQ